MHGNHRLRARRDGRFDELRVDVERRVVDVHQHRPRAEARDGAGRREERIGGRDDLVAGLDVEGHQREQQRVGAGRHRDRVADAEHPRHLVLERGDLGAHDEPLAVADARDRRENLVAQRAVLRVQVEQRNLDGHVGNQNPSHQENFCSYRLVLIAARVSRSASRRLMVSRLS